ncbi:MAG: hypothetical protein AB7G08_31480 [Hyphomicrobiaceae bacterium]
MRHRAALHSDLGIAIAQAAFGETLRGRWPAGIDVATVAVQHVEDDLGRVPSVAEWAACLTVPEKAFKGLGHLGRSAFRDDPAVACVGQWGGNAEQYRPLIDWFDEAERRSGDRRAALLLQNSFGLFVAEPVREIGETLLLARYGMIPSLDAVLRCLDLRPWMYPEPSGRLHVAVGGALRRRKASGSARRAMG